MALQLQVKCTYSADMGSKAWPFTSAPVHPNLRFYPAFPGFGETGCRDMHSRVQPQDLNLQHADPVT